MARPRKNPPSRMYSLRLPLELIAQLQARGEVTAQIVAAIHGYLDHATQAPSVVTGDCIASSPARTWASGRDVPASPAALPLRPLKEKARS